MSHVPNLHSSVNTVLRKLLNTKEILGLRKILNTKLHVLVTLNFLSKNIRGFKEAIVSVTHAFIFLT